MEVVGGRVSVKSFLLEGDKVVLDTMEKWLKGKEEKSVNFIYVSDVEKMEAPVEELFSKLDGDVDDEYYLGKEDYYVRENETAISFKNENENDLLLFWI